MIAATAEASSPPAQDHFDPVLEKLAETATFDCDWPTLRHHMYLALIATLPVFLEQGPPASMAGRVPVAPALSPTASRSGMGSDPMMMSPSRQGSGQGWQMDADGRGGMSSPRSEGGTDGSMSPDASLRPSTQGGLVIPPFPPLDPDRRRRSISAPGGSPHINGTPVTARGNPFDDDWDEEIVIGGRKLPGWLEQEAGKKEVDRVAQKLESLTFAPFTVQRLAELLLQPTRLHSSLGKFLRAVEKMLSVNTPYAVPSYTYVPPLRLPGDGMPGSPSSIASSDRESDSTVPPGSMTPMFSPIPFLTSGSDLDALGESMLDSGEGGSMDEGLMSPLMLGDGNNTGGAFAAQQQQQPQQASGPRSPTPEPEVEMEESMTTEEARAVEDTSASADIGNQPYMGRVDELDAGPLTSNGHTAEVSEGERESASTGVGEGGTMTPHGMSDRPVALSSTTVLPEGEREIAPLRRTRSEQAEASREEAREAATREEAARGEASRAEEGAATGAAAPAPADSTADDTVQSK